MKRPYVVSCFLIAMSAFLCDGQNIQDFRRSRNRQANRQSGLGNTMPIRPRMPNNRGTLLAGVLNNGNNGQPRRGNGPSQITIPSDTQLSQIMARLLNNPSPQTNDRQSARNNRQSRRGNGQSRRNNGLPLGNNGLSLGNNGLALGNNGLSTRNNRPSQRNNGRGLRNNRLSVGNNRLSVGNNGLSLGNNRLSLGVNGITQGNGNNRLSGRNIRPTRQNGLTSGTNGRFRGNNGNNRSVIGPGNLSGTAGTFGSGRSATNSRASSTGNPNQAHRNDIVPGFLQRFRNAVGTQLRDQLSQPPDSDSDSDTQNQGSNFQGASESATNTNGFNMPGGGFPPFGMPSGGFDLPRNPGIGAFGQMGPRIRGLGPQWS